MGVLHVRIELFGTLLNGAERWSCGHSAFSPASPELIDAQGWADTALNTFSDMFWSTTEMQAMYHPSTALVGAKARQIDALGNTIAVGESVLTTPFPGAAGGGVKQLPPQNAIVVSLRTGSPGARFRGRMYLPAPSTNGVIDPGRVHPSSRDSIATFMGDYFTAWNADPSVEDAAVASMVGSEVSLLTQVQVGDVFDTQRRRRDALPESYMSVNVT